MLNKSRKPKRIAIAESLLLVIGVFAFAYILASSFPSVNAQTTCNPADHESCPQEPSPITNPAEGMTDDQIKKLLGKAGTIEGVNKFRKLITGGGKTVKEAAEIVTKEAPKSYNFIQRVVFGKGTRSQAFKNSVAAGSVVAVIAIIYTFISVGIRTGDWARAKDVALRIGIGAGAGLGAYTGLVALHVLGPAGWVSAGFVMLGIWASKFLKREQARIIAFQCSPWQAQVGGSNCDLCNGKNFPCTEYQCRSLGTGCELINKDSDNQRCIYKNRNDTNPPTITPWGDVLTAGYKYDPLPRGQTGVEIKYQDEECLPAFQPFKFGVQLDKDGYCKIEYNRTASFEDMRYNFGGKNLFVKNHSQTMGFPGVVHLEQADLNVSNNGEYEFYVRCQAASNGKSNREEFLFKFCIDKGPDTTSPVIRGFNWNDNSPISYFNDNEERQVGALVYTNEPATCKWAHEDKSYENMENNLTCSNNILNWNSQLSYSCSGNLTGLENRQANKFFFRCNDTFGNVNIQSKTLTLVGTQPLVINSITPNNTVIKDSTNMVKVTLEAETSAGVDEGLATCSYRNATSTGAYVKFTDTDSHVHSTNVWLAPGSYGYSVRCIDDAGNSDTKTASFSIETDTQMPIVVRTFREGSFLKIITNEEATCVYSNSVANECNYLFKDGVDMQSLEENNKHQTAWNPDKTFYIKCKDPFENQPIPNECSIVVSPFSVR